MESFDRHELGLVEEKWVREYSRGGRLLIDERQTQTLPRFESMPKI